MHRSAEEWQQWCSRIEGGFVPSSGKEDTYRSGVELLETKLRPRQLWSPDDFVLDIGCGNGRIAMALVEEPIHYLGFDPVPEAIAFCRSAFEDFPRFQFEHLDVRNSRYHPQGSVVPDTVTFPVKDETVDLALLTSVFTHLESESAAIRYLDEIQRVLKPGGRCFSTWFRSPPNQVTTDAARTVYLEMWIRKQIELRFDIAEAALGNTTSYHDQWEIVAVKNG